VNARKHLAEAAYTAHPLPLEICILAMILDGHIEVLRIWRIIDDSLLFIQHDQD